MAGNSRTPPFHGHKKRRAPTLLFSSTAWCKQNKVSEARFLPDTTSPWKVVSQAPSLKDGISSASYPRDFCLMCLLFDGIAQGDVFQSPIFMGAGMTGKYHLLVIFQHFNVKSCSSLSDGSALKSSSKIFPHQCTSLAVSISYSSPSLMPRTVVQSIRGQWALGKHLLEEGLRQKAQ